MDGDLGALVTTLIQARTFEDAADATLDALLGLASRAASRSPWAQARIARAMIHLRPADGYRRLWVRENGAAGLGASVVPSATAWRWVADHGRAVAVDVNLGTVDVGVSGVMQPADDPGEAFDSTESRTRLLARDASHILLLPLRVPGGGVDGMVSVEADCRLAMGKPFIWQEIAGPAQTVADLGAPYLSSLPVRRVAAPAPDPLLPVIGASMSEIVDMLRIFAEQDETVLLSGPTGSGKSRLARWCHERSGRRASPFETVDLATVPADLQMAELFGWRKGAFTGATKDSTGAIARAEGGTLFIDEVDKLSLRAQAGLLRVIEERRYRPIGEDASDRAAHVRFIVGTNARLRELVKAGAFREDLYYRINVLPVQVPSLAERRDEVATWAQYMLERRHGAGGSAAIAGDAMKLLLASPWPGNLRQLDNIVRRAYTLALMQFGAAARDVVVGVAHVKRAFALEGSDEGEAGEGAGEGMPLLEVLQLAAEAFVVEAERARARGAALDLDLVDALRGLVLAAAAERLGNKEEAFRLLGRGSMVQNRNHGKAFRKELERVEGLWRALGQPLAARLQALLPPDESS
jgi:DNA-binding NtrC family response regulator